MIIHMKKSHRMDTALNAEGFYIGAVGDGTTFVNKSTFTDDEINAFIANYDPLPEAKTEAKERLREHATSLVLTIYPYPETSDIRDIYNHLTDCNTTGQRMDAVEAIKDKFLTKRSQVDAQTDWQLVDAYDATVGW